MQIGTVAEPAVHDGDLTTIELRAVRIRELELRRARGEISCAECRRLKLKCDRKIPCTGCKRRGCGDICPTGVGDRVRRSRRSGQLQPITSPPPPSNGARFFTSAISSPAYDSTSNDVHKMERKILQDRIRELEDALERECLSRQELQPRQGPAPVQSPRTVSFQDDFSKETLSKPSPERSQPIHPLLAPDKLRIKGEVSSAPAKNEHFSGTFSQKEHDSRNVSQDEIVSAFGTLSITDGRTMRFLGASATEQTLQVVKDADKTRDLPGRKEEHPIMLPESFAQAGAMWPFVPSYLSAPSLSTQLFEQLPSFERATSLVEAYFVNVAWMRSAIERPQVISELLPLFYPEHYPNLRANNSISGSSVPLEGAADRPHDLALLFALFACGAAADLTQGSHNEEAKRYNALSRAALGLRNIFDESSLSACQTIFLLGSFESHVGRGPTDSPWKLISLALSIASSIGLHRDPIRWNLDEGMIEKRRRIFWEMHFADLWRSLSTGRPTTFNPDVIDVQFPYDYHRYVQDDGKEVYSVQEWRYRFARDVLPHISRVLCSAHPIKYSDILNLDKKVREFELHPYLTKPVPQNVLGTESDVSRLYPLITAWFREMSLLFIHRNFFAKAMIDFPRDPLRSPLGPSVSAAYHSAICLLRILRETYDQVALVLIRLVPIWAQALSSAVILASIAGKGRAIGFSKTALEELEQAILLFEKMAFHPIVVRTLPLIKRMRNKARAAHNAELPGASTRASTSGPTEIRPSENNPYEPLSTAESDGLTTDELLVLRGVAHISAQQGNQQKARADPRHSPQVARSHIPAHSELQVAQVPLPFSTTDVQGDQKSRNLPSSTTIPTIVNSNLFQDVMMAQLGGANRQPSRNDTFARQQFPGFNRAGPNENYFSDWANEGDWSNLAYTDTREVLRTTPVHDQGATSDAQQHQLYEAASAGPSYNGPQNDNILGAPILGVDSSFFNVHDIQSYMQQHLPTAEVDTIMSYPLSLTPSVKTGPISGEEGWRSNANDSGVGSEGNTYLMAMAGATDDLGLLDWDSFWRSSGSADNFNGWQNGDEEQARRFRG